MEFTSDIYTLRVEEENNEYSINLYQTSDLISPLLYLNLKPLNEINTEFDDKLQVRDIPRNQFGEGDFYQSSVTKYDKSEMFRRISLLSISHDILLQNRNQLLRIKRIFSSSLNRYKEEIFFTDLAVNFWNIQLSKSQQLPVFYFQNDKRYFLLLNQQLQTTA
jgi:hypothetical protein